MSVVRFPQSIADFEDSFVRSLREVSECRKIVGDNAICGCRLDCHLHDRAELNQDKNRSI
jgi:hypothetical protein